MKRFRPISHIEIRCFSAAVAFLAIGQVLLGQATPGELDWQLDRVANSRDIEDLAVGLAYVPANQEIAAARQRITEIPSWDAWFEEQFRKYAPAARGHIKARRYEDQLAKETLEAEARGESLARERERELDALIRHAIAELPGEEHERARDRVDRLCFTLSCLKSREAVKLIGYLVMEEGLHHDGGDYSIASTQQVAAANLSNLAEVYPLPGNPPVKGGLQKWRPWWQEHYRNFGAPTPTLPGLEPAQDSSPDENRNQKKGSENPAPPAAQATEEQPTSKDDGPAKSGNSESARKPHRKAGAAVPDRSDNPRAVKMWFSVVASIFLFGCIVHRTAGPDGSP